MSFHLLIWYKLISKFFLKKKNWSPNLMWHWHGISSLRNIHSFPSQFRLWPPHSSPKNVKIVTSTSKGLRPREIIIILIKFKRWEENPPGTLISPSIVKENHVENKSLFGLRVSHIPSLINQNSSSYNSFFFFNLKTPETHHSSIWLINPIEFSF